MADKGWIKLHRQLQECPIWYGERFSKGQAWVDLLLLANHRDKKILFNGEMIVIQRGQYLTSTVKLAEKWGWNRKTVSSYLKLLEQDKMIAKVSDNTKTLITIENYEVFQGVDEDIGQPITQPNEQPSGQQTDIPMDNHADNPLDTNKNDKNIKNDKNDNNVKNNIRLSKDNLCQTESVRRVVEEWNTLSEYGIKPVSRLTNGTKRYDSLVARLRKYSVDDVMKAIDNIRHSDFLQGKHNGKPWQITFDWFVLPNNFPKVLEGNYDNTENVSKAVTGNAYIDAIHNRVSEVDNW